MLFAKCNGKCVTHAYNEIPTMSRLPILRKTFRQVGFGKAPSLADLSHHPHRSVLRYDLLRREIES